MSGTEQKIIERTNQNKSNHSIPIGSVVDLKWDHGCASLNIHKDREGKEVALSVNGTIRLIVVGHHRDCDGTPLYVLSDIPVKLQDWTFREYMHYRMWSHFVTHGWSSGRLTGIGRTIRIDCNNIFEYIASMRKSIEGAGLLEHLQDPPT